MDLMQGLTFRYEPLLFERLSICFGPGAIGRDFLHFRGVLSASAFALLFRHAHTRAGLRSHAGTNIDRLAGLLTFGGFRSHLPRRP